ncbi:riboflavin kinase [Paenarthrobacter sp. CC6]|uniref:riboflavin kinase n=1 Tax=Paenarthrobacter sp. CC6 TaxID=3029184 RepID=UPI00339D0831
MTINRQRRQSAASAPGATPEAIIRINDAGHLGAEGPASLAGVVERGDARGRELGFPTANISVPHADIPDGVWAGTVQVEPATHGNTYLAAVSIGRRPTYYRKGLRLLEAHLLDFNANLYGLTVLVTLHVHVRAQRRFRDTEELVTQIRDDVNYVRSWAAEYQQ